MVALVVVVRWEQTADVAVVRVKGCRTVLKAASGWQRRSATFGYDKAAVVGEEAGMVEVRILGPLEVMRGEIPLTLGGTKQRAVFAMLALRINRVVSMDSLVEGLWSAPPTDPTNVVQVYLYRLRKLLHPTGHPDAEADDARLIYRKPGYLLQLDPEHLDLHRFQRLAQEGCQMLSAVPDTAAATLTNALEMWRGLPLVEFAEQPFARTEMSRLRELQLSALSARVQADLALGRHAALVAELEALVARYPLHERLHEQLMVSLYRSGRQADALEAYRRARPDVRRRVGHRTGQGVAGPGNGDPGAGPAPGPHLAATSLHLPPSPGA